MRSADARSIDRRARVAVLAALTLLLPLAACGDDAADAGFDKRGTGERRTDLVPLTDRFEAIGQPVGAVWYSGTLGSGRVPGPSTYWIDAVVDLTPDVAARWRADHDLAAAVAPPDVVGELRDDVPVGLVRGDGLDAVLSSPKFAVQAFLAADGNHLVITAIGEG